MATSEEAVVNGVDVSTLDDAVEASSGAADVGRFTFRAETGWTDALDSVTPVDEFDGAGETVSPREFTIEGDGPEQILGDRTAPNAVELLLTALGSRLSAGYAANAAVMGTELEDLRFEMDGDVNLRGFAGISEDVRPGFDTVRCTVHADADTSTDEPAELRERAESTSPPMDNIANAVELETGLVVDQV